MLQCKKEFKAPLKEHQEILRYLTKTLGQQVQFSENQIVEKVFQRDGFTINNNQIILRIINNSQFQCEHLLRQSQIEDVDIINFEDNIPQDCSSLIERLGFRLKKRDEYTEKVYFIKFMNCSISVQETKTKKLTLQLRDTIDLGSEVRISLLKTSLIQLLENGGII